MLQKNNLTFFFQFNLKQFWCKKIIVGMLNKFMLSFNFFLLILCSNVILTLVNINWLINLIVVLGIKKLHYFAYIHKNYNNIYVFVVLYLYILIDITLKCKFLSDCSCFDSGKVKPQARYGHSQMALDDDNLLIIGGSGGPSFYYSDVWVLNMSQDVWKWIPIEVRNSPDAPANLWSNPACKVSTN